MASRKRDRYIVTEESLGTQTSNLMSNSEGDIPGSNDEVEVIMDDMDEMGSPLLTMRKHKRKYRKEQIMKDLLVRELDLQLHAASKFDSLFFPLKRFGYLCIGGHAVHSVVKWALVALTAAAFVFAYISVTYQLATDGKCTTETKQICVIDWSWWFTKCDTEKKSLSTKAIIIIAFLILIGSYATGLVFVVFPFILGPLQWLCYIMHL